MRRVAIAGLGKLGQRHLAVYDAIDGVEVAGVYEPDTSVVPHLQAQRERPLRAYGSFDDLTHDPEVGVVDVCTPTHLHFEQVGQALRAGKHVFCEKPLAPTTAEVAELGRLATRENVSLRVGYLYRFHPRVERLKRRLEARALGDPHVALLRIGGRGSHQAWKHRSADGGGALLDMASHMVDLAGWLFGSIVEIEPLVNRLVHPQREIAGAMVQVDANDLVVVRLRSATGVEVLVHADFVSPGFANMMEISGENGSALVSVISGIPDRYVLRAPASDLPAGETFESGDSADMLEGELASFTAELGSPVVDVDGSLLVGRVAESFGPAGGCGRG